MTKHEIEILNVMRSRGKTAMDIALTLQISVNTVRSYIRRHPPEDAVRVECRQCGKPTLQVKGRKAKYFCSDKCRNAWWNAHPEKVQRKAYYHLTCEYCGSPAFFALVSLIPVVAAVMSKILITELP